jgi:hypothetical protein
MDEGPRTWLRRALRREVDTRFVLETQSSLETRSRSMRLNRHPQIRRCPACQRADIGFILEEKEPHALGRFGFRHRNYFPTADPKPEHFNLGRGIFGFRLRWGHYR